MSSGQYTFEEFSSLDHINKLNEIVVSTGERLEGNCLYQHDKKFEFHRFNKEFLRKNLFQLCKTSNSIMEVGFNAGHSVALYTYANPNISVRSFDICVHKYTKLCSQYITDKTQYDFKLIVGDSRDTLKSYDSTSKFDLIHIDGGHGYNAASSDLSECKKFSTKDTLVIVDDAYLSAIARLLHESIQADTVVEVDYSALNLAPTKYHRIFRYA